MLEQCTYHIIRAIAKLILKTHNIEAEKLPDIKGNYIILSNHSNYYDPGIIMAACKKTAYFVIGENLYRKRNIRFIDRLLRPIYIMQGHGAPIAVMHEIYNRINNGENIVMYPEGNYSHLATTQEISRSTAGLAKMLGCTLVTYRVEGGYYNYPYWADGFRNGPARGVVAGIYSADELAKMSEDEVHDLINKDLYTDADELQSRTGATYRGRRLAEGLENILSVCPKCGQYNSIFTNDDVVRCAECGCSSRFTEKGTLEGGFPFDRVSKWQRFSNKKIDEDVAAGSLPELTYKDVKLFQIFQDHSIRTLDRGDLIVTQDEMHICGRKFKFKDIHSQAALHRGNTMMFSTHDGYYELEGERLQAQLIEKLLLK